MFSLFREVHAYLRFDQDARDRAVCKKWNIESKEETVSRKARLSNIWFAQKLFNSPLLTIFKNSKKLYEIVEKKENYHVLLIEASKFGHLELVKYLVNQGADVTDGYIWAVKWAAHNGHLELVKYLLSMRQRMDISKVPNIS